MRQNGELSKTEIIANNYRRGYSYKTKKWLMMNKKMFEFFILLDSELLIL